MAWVEKHGSGYRIRYRLPDGTLTSETGFATRSEAAARAGDVEAEQRIGTFVDPRLAQTSVSEWIRLWSEAHDVGAGTWGKYDSHLRNHILPRFGAMSLGEINRMTIKAWVKTLRRSLAEPTVIDVVSLLSTILSEAVDEGLIGANSCRRLRLNTGDRTERPHATPQQIRDLTHRMNPSDALLVLTAAYTGMRWGELVGLQWSRVDLDTGKIHISRVDGALHEINGHHTLGRPKTPASVAPSTSRDSWSTDSTPTGKTAGKLRRCSPRRTGAGTDAPTSADESGYPPSTATRRAAGRPSHPDCTSTTSATPTKPGSSKTAYPRCSNTSGSATGSTGSAASTPTSRRRWSTPCSPDSRRGGSKLGAGIRVTPTKQQR
ncbi:hypothetical protein JT362_20955 [Actinophytocola sp. S1-96]|uniref:Core-binding (CB) domain-containing protein n=1 Tax=Actinophytocola gossypii TaxID=2812003 RepID=A0ABT2JCK0_9PSEU|nr:hypothetical protein [Actinophytocola gossypii]MCT2585592.1 hypothetical protein [Actinophytocola gossypii]